jgi:hypothetical protein
LQLKLRGGRVGSRSGSGRCGGLDAGCERDKNLLLHIHLLQEYSLVLH